ncbi:PIN domain-containing protein [Paenarthrobacter sp. A20]|uniref:PIN domain-containing protein n=1 Tax=Paenarthrobacter sp. A20 TaxID=2817891 RepID=UPI00209E0817|nr:PIN domain-containing protein [Paenarthrobacter sp. A20]MCP1415494.1 rRNA-processing protein FCF1 [Paenarthrobacter sp. A20]
MIKLAVGASPKAALGSLSRAVNEAENARGAGGYSNDRYHRYLEWAGDQIYALSSALSNDEIERLVATKLYSMLLSLDPSSVSTLTLGRLVDGELGQCIQRLKAAEERISAEERKWEQGSAVAVVLDTNVWLKYYQDPLQVDLNQVLDERASVPLVVAVPMKVVDELDGHKRNRANPPKGGLPIRRRAALALKYLEAQATAPGQRKLLKEQVIANQSPSSNIYLTVLEQSLSQPSIQDADLEIIDRAAAIRPYAKHVKIVTTDYGMIYRARQAGLDAVRITDYEEEQEVPPQL